MEGFKANPKMRSDISCYKEGGSVGYKSRHSEKTEMKEDVAQDKAMVKKGVAQHEAAKHKGEAKTELKLKTGGRCKKEKGTVKKYKAGGSCYKEGGETKKPNAERIIGMKKDADDIKQIAAIKREKAKKLNKGGTTNIDLKEIKKLKAAEMPTTSGGSGNIPGYGKLKAAEMPTTGGGGLDVPGYGKLKAVEMPTSSKMSDYKKGGKTKSKTAKKYEDGGSVFGGIGTRLKNNLIGTPEQNAEAKARLDRIARQKSGVGAAERAIRAMSGQGAVSDAERAAVDAMQGQGAMSNTERELLDGVRVIGRAVGGKV